MSTLVKTKTEDQSGKKFRLVVRSAEEAVRVIRDKLGDKAKVLSVRQVGGEGLKRFISSPKLEVIAQVVEEDDVVEEAIKPEVLQKFSLELSEKMANMDSNLEVPQHYIENELKVIFVKNLSRMYKINNKVNKK